VGLFLTHSIVIPVDVPCVYEIERLLSQMVGALHDRRR
jgi:hypothetical protein